MFCLYAPIIRAGIYKQFISQNDLKPRLEMVNYLSHVRVDSEPRIGIQALVLFDHFAR
jgi:hypothetical protein